MRTVLGGGGQGTSQLKVRLVSAKHPPAQFTLLRLLFNAGNDFAEGATSGKCGAPGSPFSRSSPFRRLLGCVSATHCLIESVPMT